MSLLSHVVSMVLTRVDYGSTTLAGLPDQLLHKLQSVLKAAARLVCSGRKFNDQIMPLLRDLHWLPFPERITFHLAVLASRSQHEPLYLANKLREWLTLISCCGLHRRWRCSLHGRGSRQSVTERFQLPLHVHGTTYTPASRLRPHC